MASILDTPTAVASSTHTFSVSAGTNRTLVVGLTGEGTQSGNHTCTYGGQTMQLVATEIAGSGSTQQTVTLFFLNDAGIAAASGTTITPGNVPADLSIHAASYEDCVQTTPTNTDTDTSNAATPNPLAALDITTTTANAIVCALSGMGNAGSAAWASPLTERTDQATASANGSFADDEVASTTTVACECTWTTQNRSAAVACEIEHLDASGISSVDSDYGDASDEFDFDDNSVDLNGANFEASQGSGAVYISDASTLAGSANEVEIDGAINTWADTLINLDFTGMSQAEVDDLHTLGPSASRWVIVTNNSSDEYSRQVTLHRPKPFEMAAGALVPGTTTARLTGLTGTFGGGRAEETAAQNPSTTTTDVASNGNREDLWSVQGRTVAREVSYDFRVLYGGNVADTITQTPQVTIAESGATGALTTVASTSAVGTTGVAVTIALTGVLATGSVGDLGNDAAFEITGVSSTSSVGSVGFEEDGSATPTGVQTTSAEGSVTTSRTLSLTGNQGQSETGTPGVGVTISLTGVDATITVGSVGVAKSGSAALTGNDATSAVGSVGFTEAGSVGITGIETVSAVGTVTTSTGGGATPTGVQVEGQAGDVGIAHAKALTGTPSVGGVGSVDKTLTVSITGVQGTLNVGSVSASSAGGATLSGVSTTLDAGSVGFTKSGQIAITGVAGTGEVGDVSAGADAIAAITGVESTAEIGSVGFTEAGTVGITGVQTTGQVGDITISAGATIAITGVEAIPDVGDILFTKGGSTALTGVEATAEVGNVDFTEAGSVSLTGVEATAEVGSVGFIKPATSITVSSITGGASLSSLSYVVFDQSDIGIATVIKQANDETTDSNGDLVIDLTGLGVLSGDILTVIITDYTNLPTASNHGAVCHGVAA